MAMFRSARSGSAPACLSTSINGAGVAASIPARIPWSTAPRGPFEQARADFEAAWRDYRPGCNEADFTEYRRQRDWTAWTYAMWDAGMKLPTQLPDGRARCFCGTLIDIPGTAQHVYGAHI